MVKKVVKKRTRSEARKAYWASISKEQRIEKGRKMALIKATKMTPKERKEHAMKMVKARLNRS